MKKGRELRLVLHKVSIPAAAMKTAKGTTIKNIPKNDRRKGLKKSNKEVIKSQLKPAGRRRRRRELRPLVKRLPLCSLIDKNLLSRNNSLNDSSLCSNESMIVSEERNDDVKILPTSLKVVSDDNEINLLKTNITSTTNLTPVIIPSTPALITSTPITSTLTPPLSSKPPHITITTSTSNINPIPTPALTSAAHMTSTLTPALTSTPVSSHVLSQQITALLSHSLSPPIDPYEERGGGGGRGGRGEVHNTDNDTTISDLEDIIL